MYEVALVDEKWVEEDKVREEEESEESEEGLKKEKAMGRWGDITVRCGFVFFEVPSPPGISG